MQHFKLIVALMLIGLVVLFAVQNYEVVQLRLLFWSLEMSRALLLFLVFTTGVALGWIVRSLK
jgi:lipopolysaccharide assembly protein A